MTADDPDAGPVYQKDGRWVYRASAIGGCLKALVAARMGYDQMPPPGAFKEKFAQGHYHENAVLAEVQAKADGLCLLGKAQYRVELPVMDGVVIVGHIDELADFETAGKSVVDAKTLARMTSDNWRAQKWNANSMTVKWAWQQSAYAYALAEEFGEPRGRPLPIIIAVGVKDDDDPMHLAYSYMDVFLEPPITRSQIIGRVAKVEAYARRGVLPEKCEPSQYPCPVYYLCDGPKAAEMARDDDGKLAAVAALYRSHADVERAAKKAKDELRPRVLEAMGEREKVAVDGLTVTVSTGTRRGLDRKRLAEEHPEIDLAAYETETEFTKLEVR